MKKNLSAYARSAFVVAALAGATCPVAAETAKEGRIDVVYCFVGHGHHQQSMDGVNFGTALNHTAAINMNPSGSPFDHFGGICVVVYNTNPGGKSAANGHCENVDSDGDKWVYSFADEGNNMDGTWEFTRGTGKYDGARMSGTFKPIGPLFFGTPGHIQRCLKVSGNYRLR